MTLTPDLIERLTASLQDRPHNKLRDELRTRLANHIARQIQAAEGMVLVDSEFDNLMERVWPRLTAQQLLRDTFTIRRRLRQASEGILSEEEIALLSRPRGGRLTDEPWTEADYPLLDEASFLLDGEPSKFGHVIVDEAQDLTPMQLRSIARRCGGTVTVLGDLAQATGPWLHATWQELVEYLPGTETAEFRELDIGYRVPAQAFKLAARLLPTIAPHVGVPDAIREGPTEPRIRQTEDDHLLTQIIEAARSYASDGNSVGIIAPVDLAAAIGGALTGVGVSWSDGAREGPSAGITVLPSWAAKGLEFDAVIVAEPAQFADEAPQGLRLLYVALTRCTRHLTIVHSRPLPEELSDHPVVPPALNRDETAELTPPEPESNQSDPRRVSLDTEALTERVVEQVGAALLEEARRFIKSEDLPKLLDYLRTRLE